MQSFRGTHCIAGYGNIQYLFFPPFISYNLLDLNDFEADLISVLTYIAHAIKKPWLSSLWLRTTTDGRNRLFLCVLLIPCRVHQHQKQESKRNLSAAIVMEIAIGYESHEIQQ